MSDLAAALSSVRAQQEVLAGRRDELESQLAEVDREQGRLAAAVSVMEEHLRSQSGSSATDQRPGSRRLVDQILDELDRSPGRTRADLLRVFADRNANTVSAGIARLCKRGAIVNNDGHYSRVVQGPEQEAPGHRPMSIPLARISIRALPTTLLSPMRSIVHRAVLFEATRSRTLELRRHLPSGIRPGPARTRRGPASGMLW